MTSNNLTSIQDIHTAINTVNDPEYPGISIVDLGLLENIEINTADEVLVELIPTFSGCPALGVIAQDIEEVVRGVPGVKKEMGRVETCLRPRTLFGVEASPRDRKSVV